MATRVNRAVTRKAFTPSRRQVSQNYSAPAPTGGLNTSANIANMRETDALVLDNFFPNPTSIDLRSGRAAWSTGYATWVETLMGYSNASGEQLFAISGTSVFNATTQGAIGSAVVTALTNARWESTNFATSGGQYLYAGNGVDKPLLYDGTTWTKVDAASTPAITGVTTTKLRSPAVWKSRLWWVEENSMNAWYLPTSSIGGAAAKFDLGPIFRLGGKLHVIMTAGLTDGSTFDDYICFMSTEGEIAVYRGTDPATFGLFVLQGVYPVGKPIGRRCFFRSGADTIIITTDGVVSLSKLISIGRVNNQESISYKIQLALNNDLLIYGANFGWEGIYHPAGNKIIVNVPLTENSSQTQFVMNTLNGSWCTFGRYNSAWNAATFCVLGNNLYYGGSNAVYLADTGQSDAGMNIFGTLKTSFNYFKTDRQKFVTMVRPIIITDGDVSPSLYINVDFNNQSAPSSPTFGGTSGSPWNTSPWNTSP